MRALAQSKNKVRARLQTHFEALMTGFTRGTWDRLSVFLRSMKNVPFSIQFYSQFDGFMNHYFQINFFKTKMCGFMNTHEPTLVAPMEIATS